MALSFKMPVWQSSGNVFKNRSKIMAEKIKPPSIVLNPEQEERVTSTLALMKKGKEIIEGMKAFDEDVSAEEKAIDDLMSFGEDFLRRFGSKKLIK